MIAAPILVLIVNYRTAALSVQAVEAILPEVRSRGDAHILIVDNGSADGSVALLREAIAQLNASDCCSVLALDDNLGFAAGNNAGLDHYRAAADLHGGAPWPDYTWLLNPDTVAEPHALGALVEFLSLHPEAGIAGGRCLRPDGSIRPSAFRFHTPLNDCTAVLDFGPLRQLLHRHDVLLPTDDLPCRAEWLSGSHLMIRGAVFDRIGPLDPGYFLYFEETDFCSRAADAGFQAWHVPASRIVHLGGSATGLTEQGPMERRPRYWFASRARFMIRRYGRTRTHLANLLWLGAWPLGAILARLRSRPRRDPPRLWLDFLRYNYGIGGLMYDQSIGS
ncbi:MULTISPECIES: glycosyltransferase family 2 protein [unclassified Sphingomonas]|uniref:glycosyltransferase family 2 protein n=1 Tax=unclassified Sphingomonas TaxID=196159 RepID=UPI0006FDCA3C|nr:MULTISPECIES: glycosyltransferase family 2 protein [unclassified Sphingomonas]KQX18038.1 glycosyl transferase [Sphingomonas sp. Root1294]KQY72593.1 glycosyl transferase [Sphingomonas sp. Root50]KRB87783.1 glycosyl transferase [Sphingomonas sp. Root720]